MEHDLFCRTERHRAVAERAADLARRFAQRAGAHDRDGTFPAENFADLYRSGHSLLTVPQEFGGQGGGVYEMVLAQNYLARGDGSTALAIGWHLFKLGQLGETHTWPADIYERVCRGAVQQGYLINAIISEPETGSPSRGGRPTTSARQTEAGWVLNGRKTFSTLSPVLHYFAVSAAVEGSEENGWFLVERGTPGLEVVETWDTLGMRATGSHDVLLREAAVAPDALVQRFGRGVPAENSPGRGAGWNLHIPAVYLGIAEAARDYAVAFAASHKPNSISTVIGELPNVQAHLGAMELGLLAARTLLFTLAERWDAEPVHREELMAPVAGAKVQVVTTALDVVDRAMRVAGAQSLMRACPLERYYRDVRAGLHNPPMEDAALTMLARAALNRA
ncbi:MAG TPA: acyl-CoA dehydrogenase family protein [Symbiobacteriaceae bacterium]|nr:acyl-CoA dehydrogenase family protein [Symbiobacteriaceae bacterium]